MKRFFCLQTIAFCYYGNDETSGQELSFSDGNDIIDLDALQESAEHGDVEAQCLLAYCLYSGRFVRRVENRIETICRDTKRAFFWWSRAARQGNAKAQYWLGYCYWFGEGTLENRTEAWSWFIAAAEQGETEAISWLRSAAAQNHREAILFLEQHGIA